MEMVFSPSYTPPNSVENYNYSPNLAKPPMASPLFHSSNSPQFHQNLNGVATAAQLIMQHASPAQNQNGYANRHNQMKQNNLPVPTRSPNAPNTGHFCKTQQHPAQVQHQQRPTQQQRKQQQPQHQQQIPHPPSVQQSPNAPPPPLAHVVAGAASEAVSGAANNASAANTAKPRRQRTTFSPTQLNHMESTFDVNKYPDDGLRDHLAAILGLRPYQVRVWFKNRRAKWRKAAKNKNDTEEAQKPILGGLSWNDGLCPGLGSNWVPPAAALGHGHGFGYGLMGQQGPSVNYLGAAPYCYGAPAAPAYPALYARAQNPDNGVFQAFARGV